MADESILENPGEHTVEDVTAALDAASPDEVETVKALERNGKNRRGITEYSHPDAPPADGQDRYDLEGWRERARGWLGVSPHAVAGALHGEQGPWTQDEVKGLLTEFLKPKEGDES